MGGREWRTAYDRADKRSPAFSTLSFEPVPALGEPATGEVPPSIGYPGQYPYTRGIHASGYRGRLWTMRQFAGFADAGATNRRFRQLLEQGQDGLSTAFDMPTLMGYDSDHPRAAGEVGHCGVAVDTVDDMARLYEGIDLETVSVSMTISGPAQILFAFFLVAAEEQGARRARLRGTLQADILKEYIAQKEWVFPPEPHIRLLTDQMEYCLAETPLWNTISVSGYHIREAGATAAQELAFTLGDGFAYVEAGMRRGLAVDDFAPRLSFFFDAHIDFFEEIAKFRAARRLWARWLRERYGARSERSLKLRFHAQTAGVSLTAQQPENNIVRTAVEALAATLGGAQSLHTNALDEVYALPTERASEIALRTQQVIASETGIADSIDPLGGSWLVEEMTDRMEAQAEKIMEQVADLGGGSMLTGALRGIEEGFFQSAIADSAYRFERAVDRGERKVVGVNCHQSEETSDIELLRIGPEVEEGQRERLAAVRAGRDEEAVAALRQDLEKAAAGEANLMPLLVEAARARATLGEITDSLRAVFGAYREPSRI